jgi:hypothetical protein
MAQGMQVVAIPTPGVVGGRPRKEPLYDSEVIKGSTTIPTEILIFQNFAQFRVAPEDTNISQAKEQGRDTNLQGGQSGLPQSTAFFWYQWRLKIRTLGINLGQATLANVSEEIRRLRQLSSVTFRFSQTDLITVQADELPDGVGPTSHHSNVTGAVSWGLVNGVPHRNNFKDVTVSGKPVGINALEQFRIVWRTPTGAGLTPDIDYFLCPVLDGLLIRGITG